MREKERLPNVPRKLPGSQYGAVLRLSLSLTPFTLSRTHAYTPPFSFIAFHLAFPLHSCVSSNPLSPPLFLSLYLSIHRDLLHSPLFSLSPSLSFPVFVTFTCMRLLGLTLTSTLSLLPHYFELTTRIHVRHFLTVTGAHEIVDLLETGYR